MYAIAFVLGILAFLFVFQYETMPRIISITSVPPRTATKAYVYEVHIIGRAQWAFQLAQFVYSVPSAGTRIIRWWSVAIVCAGGVGIMAICLGFTRAWIWLWWRTRPAGLCVQCGYDIAGLDDVQRCPECGTTQH